MDIRVHVWKTHCNYGEFKVTLTGSCCFLHNSMRLVKFIGGLDLNSYNDNAQVTDATPAPFCAACKHVIPSQGPQ